MLYAVDSETCLIMPGVLAPPLVCVSYAYIDGDKERKGLLHRSESLPFLRKVFAPGVHSTYCNAPFDLAVFMRAFPELIRPIFTAMDEGRIHDVAMREKLNDIAAGMFRYEQDENGDWKYKGYALAEISERWGVGGKLHDRWRLRYHELYDTAVEQWPDEAKIYAVRDAVMTLRVHRRQKDHPNEAAQNQAHFALHLASCRGIRTNEERVFDLEAQTRVEIAKHKNILVDSGLVREDGSRNTKAAVRRMAKVMGKRADLTKKGQELAMEGHDVHALALSDGRYVSVARDACWESGDPLLKHYAGYSQANSLLTGAIKHLKMGITTAIQSRFEPLMETGRTSSRKPNIQNPRRAPGVRECFMSRTGYFVDADISSAELHTLAQDCLDLFGHSALVDALNDGRDVHLWLGAMVVGKSYDEDAYANGDQELIVGRQFGKVGNFGFPGGCGAERFCAIARGYTHPITKEPLELDLYTASRLRATWHKAWPEMQKFFDYVGNCTDARGWNYTRLLRAERMRGRATFPAACNTRFQGPASDGAKAWTWEVCKAQWLGSGALSESYTVNFIHDELLLEAPIEGAHEIAMELQAIGEEAFNRFVPDCPTTIEALITPLWSKGAKPRWMHGGKRPKDKHDRLVPWAPSP